MSSVAKTKRPMSSGRAKRVAKNSLIHIILGILVVIWLFPIFWIVMTSFRAESGAYSLIQYLNRLQRLPSLMDVTSSRYFIRSYFHSVNQL